MDVVEGRLPQGLVVDTHPLQVQVQGDELVAGVSFPCGRTEVGAAVGVEVLGLGVVGVDEGEAVVQPAHLDRVPGLPQLPQPRQLVHHLLLLRDPQGPSNN